MTFPEWSAAIVAGVRVFLPDAQAVRKGARVVVIRHGYREARLEAGGSFWITFPAGEMKTTMASLVDDRRDVFTVNNLAHRSVEKRADILQSAALRSGHFEQKSMFVKN